MIHTLSEWNMATNQQQLDGQAALGRQTACRSKLPVTVSFLVAKQSMRQTNPVSIDMD
jgi:hypothetical protein